MIQQLEIFLDNFIPRRNGRIGEELPKLLTNIATIIFLWNVIVYGTPFHLNLFLGIILYPIFYFGFYIIIFLSFLLLFLLGDIILSLGKKIFYKINESKQEVLSPSLVSEYISPPTSKIQTPEFPYFIDGLWRQDPRPETLEKLDDEQFKNSWFYGKKIERITDLSFIKNNEDKIFQLCVCAHINNEIYFIGSESKMAQFFRKMLSMLADRKYFFWHHSLSQEQPMKGLKEKYSWLGSEYDILLFEKKDVYFLVIRRSEMYHLGTVPYYDCFIFPLLQKKHPTEEQTMKIVEENIDWITRKEGAKKKFEGTVYAFNSLIY